MKTFDPIQVARESKRFLTVRFQRGPEQPSASVLARSSVIVLDVLALSIAGLEAARELGLTTWEQVTSRGTEWSALTESLAGIAHVEGLLGEVQEHLPKMISSSRSLSGLLEPSLEQARDIAQIIVSSCPADELAEIVRGADEYEIAYRCRVAHSRLPAILYRIGKRSQHRLAVAGRAFVEGRISAEELASFLELDVPDVIDLLESPNYVRPMSAILLNEDERAAIYQKLRERRMSGSRDLLDERAVRREVLASNRIEGIGSHRWPSGKT